MGRLGLSLGIQVSPTRFAGPFSWGLNFATGVYQDFTGRKAGVSAFPGYVYTRSGAKSELGTSGALAFASNVPGIVPNVGYFARPQHTNIVASSYGPGTSGQADPEGGTAATLFTGNSNNSSITVVVGQNYTLRRIVKRGSNDWLRVVVFNTASPVNQAAAWINLATGELGTTVIGGSGFTVSNAAVRSLGSGFHELSFTFSSATATGLTVGDRLVDGNGSATLASVDATTTFYHLGVVAGTQVGPIIHTTGSAATVGADDLRVASPVTSDEDFIFWSVLDYRRVPTAITRLAAISDGTNNNRLSIYRDGTGFGVAAVSGGVSQAAASAIASSATGRFAAALIRRGGRFDVAVKRPDNTITINPAGGAGAFPVGLSSVYPGSVNGLEQPNSPIEGVYIKRGTFSDADINSILGAA